MEKKFIERIVEAFLETEGSDLHLVPDSPLVYREKGEIKKTDRFGTLSKEDVRMLFNQIVDLAAKESVKKRDFIQKNLKEKSHVGFSAIFLDNVRFRVQASLYNDSYYIVLRILKSTPPKLEDLGLPQKTVAGLKYVSSRRAGLFLVVGATGSGKTTTLSSIINEINLNMAKNIITLEDPIEYEYKAAKSNVIQKELGRDFEDFNEAIRSALREDPDVILVGEIRDKETLSLALELSETGHLVFGTLHTNTVVSTIQRMVAMSGEEELTRNRLAQSLIGVLAQMLIKNQQGELSVVTEFLIVDKSISANIREGEDVQINSSLDTYEYSNSFNHSLRELFKKGKIDVDMAYRYSPDPKYLNLEDEIFENKTQKNEIKNSYILD